LPELVVESPLPIERTPDKSLAAERIDMTPELAPGPLCITTLPPVVDPVPAMSPKSPPTPTPDVPGVKIMEPAAPPLATPVDNAKFPEASGPELLPVEIPTDPVIPALDAEMILITPLPNAAEPAPLRISTEPPTLEVDSPPLKRRGEEAPDALEPTEIDIDPAIPE